MHKSCLFKCCIRLCLESQTSNVIRRISWNMYRDDEWFKVKTHGEIPGPLSLAFMRWALLNYLMALWVCFILQYLKCPSKHASPACVYALMCISDGFCSFFPFSWLMCSCKSVWSGSSGPVFPWDASVGGLPSATVRVTPRTCCFCCKHTHTHTNGQEEVTSVSL